MKTDKQNELLRILSEATSSISSTTLAGMLGISERTVRNYIKSLNESEKVMIKASRDGYSLQNRRYDQDILPTEKEARIWRVLADLLANKEGINAFDEADSLFLSASTVINTIIPQIKHVVKEFELSIESRKYQFFLKGSEQNKRRLIGHIATGDSYGFFSTKDAMEQLFPQQDIPGMMQELYNICQKARIYLNDYSLNNLLLHILIILIRLGSDDNLREMEAHISADNLLERLYNKDEIVALADRISAYYMEKFGIQIPERDYQQILILIALSAEHEVVDIQSVISQEFLCHIADILSLVSERYCTPEFEHHFVMQFAVHAYYAYQRCAHKLRYPNPIGVQFKKDYAPVYDMAVFFAHEFSKIYHITLNEDEIAFVAFHFGSFLEHDKQNKALMTCTVIVESYHTFSKRLVNEIDAAFQGQLIVMEVLPLSRYLQFPPSCDLVISTLQIENNGQHVVRVNPILTRQNREDIREMLDEIRSEREQQQARTFLQGLFHKELYFRNITLDSEADYIKFMGRHCLESGYATEAFLQDVLLRESVSSTAFTDALAVPHSISQYPEKSFICVIHNNMPISWSKKSIHFILLIGISKQDMKYFKSAFELVIELFNSTRRTIALLKTNTFEEFCDRIN